ncbi:MAG TPA: hypothetical protein V6D29_08635 [Leptolyngbyaceae cyanobacterium]
MYALASDHILHFRISQRPGGVKLTLWELAPAPENRLKPYLYLVNYHLNSLEEARGLLRQHLLINGANGVANLEIPAEGKVRIMPYPTWNSCEMMG